MSWPTVELQELALQQKGAIVSGPFGSNIGSRFFVEQGVPVIRGNNLTKGERKFIDDGFVYLTDTKAAEFANCIALVNDIVFTAAGSIGQVGLIPADSRYERYVISNKQLRVRLDHEKANPLFVYFWLSSKRMIQYLESMNNGGAVPLLNLGIIRKVPIPHPPLKVQQRIASILTAYDDLIENNRRRIQLLEQAARLLYKEWFVYFRFPGHEHVKIKDGVPEGWGQATIADVCTGFEDGDWIESKDQGGNDFRLLQISNIGDNEFVETGNFRYITSETYKNLRCNEVLPGDILISRMPTPIGRAWYVNAQPWRMITSVDVTIARPNPEVVDPFYYLYHLNSPTHIARCELRATGATRPRISRKNMGALPILTPPMSIQRNFGEVASAVNAQRYSLTRQIDRLTEARDLLLPRLMNGEIAV